MTNARSRTSLETTSAPLQIVGLNGLRELEGQHLGTSPWVQLPQPDIDDFGRVTHDLHPIHVDPAYVATSGLSTTIAHGFHTLSLIGGLMQTIYRVEDVGNSYNYGLDRVRFLLPVPVESRLRLSMTLDRVEDVPTGVNAHIDCTIELADATKPACVARLIGRYTALTEA